MMYRVFLIVHQSRKEWPTTLLHSLGTIDDVWGASGNTMVAKEGLEPPTRGL